MRRKCALLAAAILVGCAGSGAPGHEPGHEHGHGHGHGHDDAVLVHRFQNAEQWSKEFDDPARDAWQRPEEVIALLRIAPGMTAVDLGAGTGYFLPHLARAVGPEGSVLALDVEADMVRYMRARAEREKLSNVKPIQVAPDDPGLAAGSAARILVVDTWHHIPAREAYAKKLRAALAPCGLIAVVDFTLDAERGPPKEHRIAPEKVVAELAAAGLVAEVAEEALPDQYVVLGRAPGGCT